MPDDNDNDRWDAVEAELPLGYLLEHVSDWDDFCDEVGLNPWLLNEGRALSTDTHPVRMSVLRKHGILK